MTKLEFSDQEATYLLVALRKYEEALMASEDDEVGDSVNDLLVIQALRKKIKDAKTRAEA